MTSSFRVLPIALLLLGCDQDEWISQQLDQPVGFCLASGESQPGLVPEPSDPLTLEVQVGPSCFSSSCSRVDEASCSYTLDGNRIVVQASLVVSERGGTCTADCQTYGAPCEIDGLPPGEYEVVDAGAGAGAEPLGTFNWPDDGQVYGCYGAEL